MAGDYLTWALDDFSGYIAADELYDGPFCVLSIVDNRRFKRLLYEVLDHNPTPEDIRRFFRRFKTAINAYHLAVLGIPTDVSPLYPAPIAEIFGPVPHQICEFHIVAEIAKAVLKAIAKVRKTLTAQIPKLPRGRPTSKAAKHKARAKHALRQKVTNLFDPRYLFVQHSLTPSERKTLARISRGHPQLRALREIMDEVYRLFDRRGRSETALQKLAKPRRRVDPASRSSASPSRNSSAPTWKRHSPSSTISCSLRLPTPWNAATVVTARCKKPSTACAPGKISATESRLICFAMPRPKGVTIRHAYSI